MSHSYILMSHSYEYDNNGNILYVNTLRLKPDMTAQPDTVQRTREEKIPLVTKEFQSLEN